MLFLKACVTILLGVVCVHEVQGVTDEEFQQLTKRMLAMESEIGLLKEKCLSHEARTSQQTVLVADLRHTNNIQEKRIKALEKLLSSASKANTSAGEKHLISAASTLPLETDNESNPRLAINQTRNHYKHLSPKALRRNSRFIQPEGIAFTALKSTTQSGIGTKQHIVFDSMSVNLGNGYHELHGLFIAPQAGVYLFTVTLLSSHSSGGIELHAALVKNGNPIVRVYAHGDSGRHDQGGQTIIANVQVGDEFWVENIDYTNAAVYGGAYSSFSGILILPM